MKIISWNVNGIRAVHRKGLFVPFIEKYKPDILCLQETKALQSENEVDLSQYEEYWNSAIKKGYSGTAIFVNKSTLGTPILVTTGFPDKICKKYDLEHDKYGDVNKEGRMVTAEFEDFYVISVYTPNSKGDLSRLDMRYKQWDPAFLEYVKDLENPRDGAGKPVIFCGDLNVAHTKDDLARPEDNEGEHGFTKEEREGADNIVKAGFIDTFREFTKGNGHYTWWTPWRNAREKNIGWRIDYFFISKKLLPKLKDAKILGDVMGSDHCPVMIELK
jgi:exodeoxyribonuclease-3